MATYKTLFGCVLILFICSCTNLKGDYKIDPATRGENVIVDTISTDITIIVPEIPGDSAARMPDDPPVSYQQPREEIIITIPGKTVRQLCREMYLSQLGVRELTGKNDGKQVEAYLRSTGLGKGYAYCAAFLKWNFDAVGVRTTITAWSPTAHNPAGLVWFQNKQVTEVKPADVFCLWYATKKRIAHTGFIDDGGDNGIVETVEANTNGGGSRDGDGVYKRKRVKRTLYSITRWIKD